MALGGTFWRMARATKWEETEGICEGESMVDNKKQLIHHVRIDFIVYIKGRSKKIHMYVVII